MAKNGYDPDYNHTATNYSSRELKYLAEELAPYLPSQVDTAVPSVRSPSIPTFDRFVKYLNMLLGLLAVAGIVWGAAIVVSDKADTKDVSAMFQATEARIDAVEKNDIKQTEALEDIQATLDKILDVKIKIIE